MPVVEQPKDSMSDGDTPAGFARASFVVINAPASSPPHVRPLLIVTTAKGEVHVPREPAAWANNLLQFGSANTFVPLSVIGRLYEHTSVAFEDVELTEDELPTIIWNYVAFRVGERSPGDPDAEHFAHWPPVRRATAYSEYRVIVDYITFCHKKYGTLPLLSIPIKQSKIPDPTKALDRDFLAHLSAHRARWRGLMGHDTLPKRRLRTNSCARPSRSYGRSMSMTLLPGKYRSPR